jgi:hypothetical protein
MPSKHNPLKLNGLQLRTLQVLQLLAQVPGAASSGPKAGEVTINRFPIPHGDHLHLGDYSVGTRDATGLQNRAVWNALTRKGLARADWPHAIVLTREGRSYETDMGKKIVFRNPHRAANAT